MTTTIHGTVLDTHEEVHLHFSHLFLDENQQKLLLEAGSDVTIELGPTKTRVVVIGLTMDFRA